MLGANLPYEDIKAIINDDVGRARSLLNNGGASCVWMLQMAEYHGLTNILLLLYGGDAVAVARWALANKWGVVIDRLNALASEIPRDQRQELLALDAEAFPALQALAMAEQRLASRRPRPPRRSG